MERALSAGRAFTLIHIGSAIKVEFHQIQLERDLSALSPPRKISCSQNCAGTPTEAESPNVSGTNDITLLIATNPELDWTYVTEWAARLGVTDLLDKARADATL
jgi:hypothetical protein